jgi:hypothetical protein
MRLLLQLSDASRFDGRGTDALCQANRAIDAFNAHRECIAFAQDSFGVTLSVTSTSSAADATDDDAPVPLCVQSPDVRWSLLQHIATILVEICRFRELIEEVIPQLLVMPMECKRQHRPSLARVLFSNAPHSLLLARALVEMLACVSLAVTATPATPELMRAARDFVSALLVDGINTVLVTATEMTEAAQPFDALQCLALAVEGVNAIKLLANADTPADTTAAATATEAGAGDDRDARADTDATTEGVAAARAAAAAAASASAARLAREAVLRACGTCGEDSVSLAQVLLRRAKVLRSLGMHDDAIKVRGGCRRSLMAPTA